MPTYSVTMRQIRLALHLNLHLHLHLQAGMRGAEVDRALKISKSVAGNGVLPARVAGVNWARGPIWACSRARFAGPALRAVPPKTSAAPSNSCRFQSITWLACHSSAWHHPAIVLPPRQAAISPAP
jgi:hypothetical protein